MYPSDYAYATDLDVCTKTGNNYDADTTNCKNKDWLLDTINYTWTMSPPFGIACLAFLVNTSGSVTTAYVYYAFGVRPVAYLKLNSQIVNGTGTRSAPYIIG